MKNKKYEIIKNEIKAPCGYCNGKKTVCTDNAQKTCPMCNGTGKYIHTTYTLIAGKMSFDMDTIK